MDEQGNNSILSNDPKTNNFVTNSGAVSYTVEDPLRGPVTYTEPTNEITLALISTRMEVEKSVDKGYATSGEELTYTSVITNTGTLNKTRLVFTDAIPAGTTFVAGSVEIDGVSYPAYDPAAGGGNACRGQLSPKGLGRGEKNAQVDGCAHPPHHRGRAADGGGADPRFLARVG